MPLCLFCVVLAIVLYLFFFYHLYLIYRNTTTNETYKWKDYKRKIEFIRHLRSIPNKDPAVEAKIPKEYADLPDIDPKTLKNIYDKGFPKNLWSVIYPPSSRPRRQPASSSSSSSSIGSDSSSSSQTKTKENKKKK